ncbi:MAG: hypothetical protein LBV74_13770 [Tannerella sp.]|jgi:hypothetical protein|nr:hypothetical protein [Tannerella sp.]
MNKIILAGIVFTGIFFLTSCKEELYEELQILIQNKTDTHMEVTLFPVVESTPTAYPICKGCGANTESKFILLPYDDPRRDMDRIVFSTTDLNTEPYTLALMAFDSIHICLPDKDSAVIKFTPEKATGYSENIFTENAAWDFRIINHKNRVMFGSNPVKYYCYGFAISEDKFVIE